MSQRQQLKNELDRLGFMPVVYEFAKRFGDNGQLYYVELAIKDKEGNVKRFSSR